MRLQLLQPYITLEVMYDMFMASNSNIANDDVLFTVTLYHSKSYVLSVYGK